MYTCRYVFLFRTTSAVYMYHHCASVKTEIEYPEKKTKATRSFRDKVSGEPQIPKQSNIHKSARSGQDSIKMCSYVPDGDQLAKIGTDRITRFLSEP